MPRSIVIVLFVCVTACEPPVTPAAIDAGVDAGEVGFTCPDTNGGAFGEGGPWDAQVVGGALGAFEGARVVLGLTHLDASKPFQTLVDTHVKDGAVLARASDVVVEDLGYPRPVLFLDRSRDGRCDPGEVHAVQLYGVASDVLACVTPDAVKLLGHDPDGSPDDEDAICAAVNAAL